MKTALTPMRPRQLDAAYKFKERTFVWRCDHCAKMFFVGVEEAQPEGIPRLTRREFDSHFCIFAAAGTAFDPDEESRKIVFFPPDEKVCDEGRERD